MVKSKRSADPDVKLWSLVKKTRHAMLQARRRELSRYGITPEQVEVMLIIDELGDRATLTVISNRTYRKVHSISAQISRMVDKGLVEKIRDTPGTTLTRFKMTTKGLKAYKRAINSDTIHTIVSALSLEERQQLTICLDKLIVKSEEVSASFAVERELD